MKIRVKPRKGIILYFIALLCGLVFSQAFSSPVSASVLVFIALIPVTLFVPFAVIPFLSVRQGKTEINVLRKESVRAEYIIKNKSILPAFCCEVTLSCIECGNETIKTMVSSLSKKRIKTEMTFSHTGKYVIKADKISVSDPLCLISVIKYCSAEQTVYILPRRIDVGFPGFEKNGNGSVLGLIGDDGDCNGVRDYRPGDRLKDVHWKLSSKSDSIFSVQKDSSDAEIPRIGALFTADSDINDITADAVYSICLSTISQCRKCVIAGKAETVLNSCSSTETARAVCSLVSENSDCIGNPNLFVVPFAGKILPEIGKYLEGKYFGTVIAVSLIGILSETGSEDYGKSFEDFVLSLEKNGYNVYISEAGKNG